MPTLTTTRSVAVAIAPDRLPDVITPQVRSALAERHDCVWATDDLGPTGLAELVAGRDLVVTSWGTPPLDLDVLGDRVPGAVAHAAGTVKRLFTTPDRVLSGEVAVFSGAARIADSVGEYCLLAALHQLRQIGTFHDQVRAGGWRSETHFAPRELYGRTVGLLGASRTGRAFARLLQPFGVDLRIVDPYLDAAGAAAMGGRCTSLEEALGSEVVSVHLPRLPETAGMIDATRLASIPDGSVVINSARSDVVDHDALLAEGASGRLRVAVDVHPVEPVPSTDPLGDGVLATPHIAGFTTDCRQALVGHVVAAVEEWWRTGEDGPDRVQPAAWEQLA